MEQPVGRERLAQLIAQRKHKDGAIRQRGLELDWTSERIRIVQDEHRAEVGPGDGDRLVLQISRSASYGQRGFLARLFRRPPPRWLWLNVRVRSRDGMPPLYFRARVPSKHVDLLGIPVLPSMAITLEWEVLLGFLGCAHDLELEVASWSWDDTADDDVQVLDDPIAELKELLASPSTPNWICICEWYDALHAKQAARALPRLRAELRHWPDLLREADPKLEGVNLGKMLRRTHTHLEIARVLRLLPVDEDGITRDDLSLLAESPKGSELSSLTVHNMENWQGPSFDTDYDELAKLLRSPHMSQLHRLELHDFDVSTTPLSISAGHSVIQALLERTLSERLRSLTLNRCRLNEHHMEAFLKAAESRVFPNLEQLDLSANTRLSLDGCAWVHQYKTYFPKLKALKLIEVGLTTKQVVQMFRGELEFERFRLSWMTHGREIVLGFAPNNPIRELDLYNVNLTDNTLSEFLTCPHFHHLHRLALSDNALTNRSLIKIAQSPHFKELRELDISNNDITDKAVLRLLERHKSFPALCMLDLRKTSLTKLETFEHLNNWRAAQPGVFKMHLPPEPPPPPPPDVW